MSYGQKIDSLDMIISILREHEKKLDESTHILDQLLGSLPFTAKTWKSGHSIIITIPKDICDKLGIGLGETHTFWIVKPQQA